MNLLSFFDKGVVLGNTFQGEFVHEISHEWLDHVFVLPVSYWLVTNAGQLTENCLTVQGKVAENSIICLSA